MKKEKKMSLLQEGIIRSHQEEGIWFQGTEFTEEKERKIMSMISENVQIITFKNLLNELVWEFYWGGIIDGFRMCRGLLKELDEFENPDFLQDLLSKKVMDEREK